MRTIQDKGMENLRYAIVANAIREYVWALRYLRKPKNKQSTKGINTAEYLKSDCEHFFQSKWFCTLSDLDGKEIMDTAKRRSYTGKINGLSW